MAHNLLQYHHMGETIPIAFTKLAIPQRRKEILSRQRLLDLMDDLLDYKLIIIAAPAGYGKTSLMIDFAHHYDWPVCWYALDPLDQDIQRFLAHFIHAIQARFKSFGTDALSALQNSPPDQINVSQMVSAITNDIFEHISEHFILVLDDYHLLRQGSSIDQFLSEFLQRTDENCHLVVTSRTLLTLPDLPLLVARSQVGGLGVEELAFIPQEIKALYQQNLGRSLNAQEAQDLAMQSEGWITGLLLTTQMLRKGIGDNTRVARTSGIGLYEYLAEQVLNQQPVNLQLFLMRSAFLEEFNASMCAEIIGKALDESGHDWHALMDATIHNNLFVLPVLEDELWLRYHHLFRDFLQDRLQRERPEEARRIISRMAEYYARAEDWEQVFNLYKRLGDQQALARLVETVGTSFIAKGKINRLAEWLEFVPENAIQDKLHLISLRASILVNQGSLQEGTLLLNKAISQAEKLENYEKLAENLVRRSVALRLLGNYKLSLDDADRALGIMHDHGGSESNRAEALRAKGVNLYQQGKLKDALQWLDRSLVIYEKEKHEQDIARLLVEIGAVNESLGNHEAAEKAYKRSLVYWQSIGDSIWQSNLLNNLGVLQHAKGDFENSFYNLEKALQYAHANGNLQMEGYALASIGDLYKDLDAAAEANDAYRQALEVALRTEDLYLAGYLRTTIARLLTQQKRFSAAEAEITAARSLAERSQSPYDTNRALLESGALALAKKEYAGAFEKLIPVEAYFAVEGHIEETARARAVLAGAAFQTGHLETCQDKLKKLRASIDEPGKAVSVFSALADSRPALGLIIASSAEGKLAGELLSRLETFQMEAQKNRKKIRKLATVVPFAPPKLRIRGFGKIEVAADDRIITSTDWQSQTARDLFFLFLAHPEGLTKEEVGLVFWPDASPRKLKLSFKNAIYRMRHALKVDVVIFQNEYYQFNRALDYEYDVLAFTQHFTRAQDELSPNIRFEEFDNALDLYLGPYLPGMEHNWVLADRQRYFDMYLTALKEVSLYFLDQKNYETALAAARKALESDPCNEEFHRLAMRVHHAAGNKAGIQKQYTYCKEVLEAEIGVPPSEQTDSLFRLLIQ